MSRGGGTTPSAPKVDSGFTSGDTFFESLGLSISGRIEQIDFAPKTDGFLKLVDTCYAELVDLKAEAATKLSLAEWRHIHALMLYGRIANCEYEATGSKQPAPTRISLPYNVRVFQPIFAMLANLGIVEDKELFARYIPHCVVPADDVIDEDDVERILDCIQYPWHESWADCLTARVSRLATASPAVTYSVLKKDYISPADYNARKVELIGIIADLSLIIANLTLIVKATRTTAEQTEFDAVIARLKHCTIDEVNGTVIVDGEPTTLGEAELIALKTAKFKEAKELKFKLARPDLTTMSSETITWKYEDNTVSRDPGAYGKRLGWDPLLWKDYSDFVDLVSPLALFSLSFPKETVGTYAWLLPRRENQTGFFVNLPKPLPAPVWIGALLLDACTLPTQRVSTWYGETDRIQFPDHILVSYVKKAIQAGMAVEQFR